MKTEVTPAVGAVRRKRQPMVELPPFSARKKEQIVGTSEWQARQDKMQTLLVQNHIDAKRQQIEDRKAVDRALRLNPNAIVKLHDDGVDSLPPKPVLIIKARGPEEDGYGGEVPVKKNKTRTKIPRRPRTYV